MRRSILHLAANSPAANSPAASLPAASLPAASFPLRRLALAAAIFAALAPPDAFASNRRADSVNPMRGLYEHRSVSVEEPRLHRAAVVDPSGTLGRQGLGENPFYPEGPGNFQD
ncbi:hypothetical protein [Methylocapsa palsarum]|uniref:Uncharacterized protein n=1 Tax=Methylocapsa palsarum TaxID=1612308 RepID=A0A1I3ZN65_9HYPH|nr:hypothetical protein [Methylocapsa palsarum]SFK45121.1 hypothetical protein SAMN05444581_10847 [Methylocapsa palsarum]